MAEYRVRRSRVRRMAAIVVVSVFLLGGYTGCALVMEDRDDIPASWAMGAGSYSRGLMPNARETTDQTCTEDLPCRWAVTSDTAVVMMFDNQMEACQAADSLPGTARQDWIAVQFTPGALTARQRADLLVHLDSLNRSPDGDGGNELPWFPWIVRICP